MYELLSNFQKQFELSMTQSLDKYNCQLEPIMSAMRYSIFNGGKRVRPSLTYLCADFFDKSSLFVQNIALAIELIHTYSLVHDDLPSMDNDILRRGKPTTHVVYGEGMAILAGDALLNLAFEMLLEDNDANNINAARYIVKNSGIKGMIGGQCLDLNNDKKSDLSLDDVVNLYNKKTSCLINCALVGSAIKCGASAEEISDFEYFGNRIGEIFQIVDDILDIESSKEILGKSIKKDVIQNKKTVVSIIGLEESKLFVDKSQNLAISRLEKYGDKATNLINFCKYLTKRLF